MLGRLMMVSLTTMASIAPADSSAAVKFFSIPSASGSAVSITSQADGKVWFSEINSNSIGMFNPETEHFSSFVNQAFRDL